MGIFKKEKRLETRTISGQELIQVEVGLKYHSRKARKEGQIGFDTRCASFYIGKEA